MKKLIPFTLQSDQLQLPRPSLSEIRKEIYIPKPHKRKIILCFILYIDLHQNLAASNTHLVTLVNQCAWNLAYQHLRVFGKEGYHISFQL